MLFYCIVQLPQQISKVASYQLHCEPSQFVGIATHYKYGTIQLGSIATQLAYYMFESGFTIGQYTANFVLLFLNYRLLLKLCDIAIYMSHPLLQYPFLILLYVQLSSQLHNDIMQDGSNTSLACMWDSNCSPSAWSLLIY